MRILLINPFYPFSEHPAPPLGLMYLAGKLEKEKHEVRILDLLATPDFFSPLHQQFENFKPKVVGVTAVTMNFPLAIEILSECKRIDPEVITIIGGPHVTFSIEETLKVHPFIDIIARGESEETVTELFEALELRKDIDSIKGLAFRRNGKTVITETRSLITDLNSLPFPAHHLIPVSKYRALEAPFPILTGRGCPGNCIFCVGRRISGAKGRFRNPQIVVDEIEQILTLGFKQISFSDDLFTYSKNHVRIICQEIRKRDLNFTWSAFARVDTVEELILDEMKSAGCTFLCFGIESASEEILQRIRKGINLFQIQKAIKLCQQKGIESLASFVLGLPGETRATIEQTVNFARALDTYYGFHLLTPFPGTEVRKYAKKYGITILTNDWTKYNADEVIVQTGSLEKKDILEVIDDYNRRVEEYIHFLETVSPLTGINLKEKQKLDLKKRKGFVWDLLKSNLIEKTEIQTENHEPNHHLDLLIKNLKDKLGYQEEYIRAQLVRLVSENLIRPHLSGKRIRWVWC